MTDLDITANFHGGDPYSSEAFRRTPSEARERDRGRILRSVREDGEATCEQLEQRLSLGHQTCSARISELRRTGYLVEVGRGTTSSGRSARIHGLGEPREADPAVLPVKGADASLRDGSATL